MLPRRYPLGLILRVRGESRTVHRFCVVDDGVGCCSQEENTMGFVSALGGFVCIGIQRFRLPHISS